MKTALLTRTEIYRAKERVSKHALRLRFGTESPVLLIAGLHTSTYKHDTDTLTRARNAASFLVGIGILQPRIMPGPALNGTMDDASHISFVVRAKRLMQDDCLPDMVAYAIAQGAKHFAAIRDEPPTRVFNPVREREAIEAMLATYQQALARNEQDTALVDMRIERIKTSPKAAKLSSGLDQLRAQSAELRITKGSIANDIAILWQRWQQLKQLSQPHQ